MPGVFDLHGRIVSVGFASGDRFVIGDWRTTPVGPFRDVMWATPADERVLLVPDDAVGRFVSSVYHFDRIETVPFAAEASPRHLTLRAGAVALQLRAGRAIRVPFLRPRWFTRFVEAPLARVLVDTTTYGVSPTGVREWYRATALRFVRDARASVDGADLGAWGPARPALRVGFGEAPRWASIVELCTSIAGGPFA